MSKEEIEKVAMGPFLNGHDIAKAFDELEDLLPEGDGVRWFVTVHKAMSETVAHDITTKAFLNPTLLEQLDIHLCTFFFDAVAADARGETKEIRHSWRPLFERRHDTGIEPVQFAMAGINAHIATDLARAVRVTCQMAEMEVDRDTDLYRDYVRINDLETDLREKIKGQLYTEAMKTLGRRLGKIDEMLETFGFWAAREAAWISADVMEKLPDVLEGTHAEFLDRTTGFANRLLLIG